MGINEDSEGATEGNEAQEAVLQMERHMRMMSAQVEEMGEISTLKEQIATLKKENSDMKEEMTKQITDLTAENKKLKAMSYPNVSSHVVSWQDGETLGEEIQET